MKKEGSQLRGCQGPIIPAEVEEEEEVVTLATLHRLNAGQRNAPVGPKIRLGDVPLRSL